MNGPLFRWQVFVRRYIEEVIEVEAETEHEAEVAVRGPRDQITYVRKLEAQDGPEDQPSR